MAFNLEIEIIKNLIKGHVNTPKNRASPQKKKKMK